MSPALTAVPALLVAVAVLLADGRHGRAARRLRGLRSGPAGAQGERPVVRSPRGGALGRGAHPVGLTAAAVVWLTAGFAGLVVAGVAVALLVGRHRRGRRTPVVGVADAALFAELLAAYLAAGATLPEGLRRAGRTGAPLAALTDTVATALAAGLPPAEAWSPLAAEPGLADVARVCVRSAVTGSGCADELCRLSRRIRHRHEQNVEQRAARAGIWLVLPLGACFLPAFVLLTVVPVVAGLLPAPH